MSAPTTAQIAALEALKHGEEHVQSMVAEYDRRRRLIVDGLKELGLTTFEPLGAFYAFPSIEASGMDDETFADVLDKLRELDELPEQSDKLFIIDRRGILVGILPLHALLLGKPDQVVGDDMACEVVTFLPEEDRPRSLTEAHG